MPLRHALHSLAAFALLIALVGAPLVRAPIVRADLGRVEASPTRGAVAAQSAASVTVAGSFQHLSGCSGDWQPDCAATHLTYSAADDVWTGSWSLPAGSYEYKAALNDSWTVNYGRNATAGGANIQLTLATTTTVTFFYDDKTHWITDDQNSVIVTAPGDFQQQLGCGGNWDPACLRSWLEDPTGSGTYSLVTTALSAGSYQGKAAINRSWTENYGQNGVPGGSNIPFSVPSTAAQVTFRYVPTTHVLTISAGHGHDNNVEYAGLGHNSQDTLYRTPFGAVTPGTRLTLRFRTFHNDVTGVRVRFYDAATSSQFFQNMAVAAANVSCYDPTQPAERCDFWQTQYTPPVSTTLYYRFIATDGTATAYYADTAMQNGAMGVATPNEIDNSYAVTVYDPSFQPIPWLRNAVIYQVFPDRFRNGNPANDPVPTAEPRYTYPPASADQIITKTWTSLPEGYCRAYVAPATPCAESPAGRDYFGGDLQGLRDKLAYLQSFGVSAIYLNPIFESASNHGYDTRDYLSINHLFGSLSDFQGLVADAHARGIKVILDGVFNHVSSDSPYFNRYGHYATVGACQSVSSPYRSWFYFQDVTPGSGPCAGSGGANSATYTSWAGFDSLPQLNKSNPDVQNLIYAGNDAVATHWLALGADGWRLDVMNDPSFPPGFWQGFRARVKAANPAAPIFGELWKKADVLPMIHGDQADSTMNYRFRNAMLGFFGTVDNKGFPDDGQANEPPSMLAAKLVSQREDYPDATYYGLMNLMDSHDTQRILWSLTPGQNNQQDRQLNAANVATGTSLLRLARVVQMTVPGAPTIYYGDEVGLTGDDDPDDRRPFPWTDLSGGPAGAPNYGAGGNTSLLEGYRTLARIRAQHPATRAGSPTFLLTDDANRTLAYLMRSPDDAVLVAMNRNTVTETLTVSATGLLPDAVQVTDALSTTPDVTASHGVLTFTLGPLSAALFLPAAGQTLSTPPAPASLSATAGNASVGLSWPAVPGAATYNVYRSPVSGGGYTLLDTSVTTAYTDSTAANGTRYYYVVHAVDSQGDEGAASPEAAATPFFPIGYAVLQYPKTISETLQVTPTQTIYGQVYVAGYTDAGGDPNGILARVGFGPQGSDPMTWTTWTPMTYNAGHTGDNNYEYMGTLRPEAVGTYDMLVSFSTDGGITWVFGDQDGYVPGSNPGTNLPGVLTVTPNADITPPAAPANLRVTDWSATSITLGWDPVGDAAEYWLYRRTGGTDYSATPLAKLPAGTTAYTDTQVTSGTTYSYTVRAVDAALNLSVSSNEVAQAAVVKDVQVTFRVRVPAETPPADTVYLPGSVAPLGPWDPGKQALTNMGGGIWQVSLAIPDGTALQYKYARGSWDRVEWWGSLVSTANRSVTISYGTTGTQLVDDTATDWGNGPDTHKAVQAWRDPLVAATSPASGGALEAGAPLSTTFSRPIQPAGGDYSTSLTVAQGSSTVSGTVTSPVSTTLVWTPQAPLAGGTYIATVTNVKSNLGGDSVVMQAPYVFTFTVTSPTPTVPPATETAAPSSTPTAAPTAAPSSTPTAAPSVSATPVPASPTGTPTGTPVPTSTGTATPAATATATASSGAGGTPTPSATATLAPTQTGIPTLVPTATGTAAPPETETPEPVATETVTPAAVEIHNAPRTVRGGRATPCDLEHNMRKLQQGCEIISTISGAGARVTIVIAYPARTPLQQTFTGRADARGHLLHIFNVPYLPPRGAKHGSPVTIARVHASATAADGTVLRPDSSRFVVVR